MFAAVWSAQSSLKHGCREEADRERACGGICSQPCQHFVRRELAWSWRLVNNRRCTFLAQYSVALYRLVRALPPPALHTELVSEDGTIAGR